MGVAERLRMRGVGKEAMLTTTAERVIRLQGAGGLPFTVFVDRLLRTFGAVYGIPESEIVTTVRVNIADGGVDTELHVGAAGDTTGLLGGPTVWQYKGTGYAAVDWADLLKGWYVKDRIRAGDAFRLAVADDMPAPTLATREADLWAEALKLNASSPAPKIVTASRLAELANRFPALVLATFHADARRDFLHLSAWGASAQDPTPRYVHVPDWTDIQRDLAAHVDLAIAQPTAVRTVQGEAGVGKTRLVFETVRHVPGAEGLVVYTQADRALDVVRSVLNDDEARLILIADECDVRVRHQLGQLLNGHRTRVRVVAIDNTLVRADSPDPELSLGKMSGKTLEEVLATNFPQIDVSRRRAYADLAEGFPRLASELCRYDAKIPTHGDVSAIIPKFVDFYRVRLGDTERSAMGALGLLTKIGYAGDVAAQLTEWCKYLGLDQGVVLQSLNRVHDGPGFVARTPRFLRVVPELIAKLAFADGWQRWAAHDPWRFLNGIPVALLDEFIKRFRDSASGEVRRVCAEYFREWADARDPADLTDLAVVRRLESLADTHPTEYLPLLRRLVEDATVDERTSVTGNANAQGDWGPRRALVWLAERFAQLPEHWSDAERILASLASAESEPNIANNATAIWGQGFRIILSGTATSFQERLARLRDRLRDSRTEVRAAARAILGAPLSYRAVRMVGPAVIAGRIPPAEWRPASRAEEHACVEDTLALYADVAQWDAETREAVIREVFQALRNLVATGHLARARAILDGLSLDDEERVSLINELDTVIEYDLTRPPRAANASVVDGGVSVVPDGVAAVEERLDEHAAAVRGWREALVDGGLHSRLLSLVGKDRWGSVRIRREDLWRRELEALASDVVREGSTLDRELPWLTSGSAAAAADFGSALGRADAEGTLFDRVMETAQPGEAGIFARGYASGLAAAHPVHLARLLRWLNEREREIPEVSADVAISVGAVAEPLERVLRLFDSGLLSVRYLYARNFPTDSSAVTSPADLLALQERLASAAERGDELALRVGLENLSHCLPYEMGDEPEPLLVQQPGLRMLAWRFFDALPPGKVPPSLWWASIVAQLSYFEPARGARFLAALFGSETPIHDDAIERALASLAVRHSEEVMEALGEVMLDNSNALRFFLGDYKALFAVLHDDVKRRWLERVGIEGARRMARHVQSPHVDENGVAVVPPFTVWFLERFGDDDRTFREFVAGAGGWRSYSGDIAAQHEEEAAVARRFFDHPLARIREWARMEERNAVTEAAAERQRVAEQDLP